jgi:hypothetical protein
MAQVPQEPPELSGDQTSPALLEMIRKHLAGTSGLRPSDGVRIEESKFFRGTVRIRGTMASEPQRNDLRRALDSIRSRLETATDVKITMFDLSGLRIGPAPPSAGSPKGAPTPESREVTEEDGEEIIQPWPGRVVPYYYFVPPPPPPARKRCFLFHRSADNDGPGYGPPPPPVYYWWYPTPPMPYGYVRYYYPY